MQYYKSLYRILTVYMDSYIHCHEYVLIIYRRFNCFCCVCLWFLTCIISGNDIQVLVIVSINTPWCTTYFHLTCSSLTLMSFTLLMLPHPECRDRTLWISILTLDLYLNLLPFRYKLLKRRFKTRPSRV